MGRKVEVFIKNILPAHSHGAYTLVLHNPSLQVQLPVLIGALEAQSIAMEMENIQSSRPLTHDLFSNTLRQYEIGINEVCIERLEEGIYYSTIYFVRDGEQMSIDSRTSDAIAMAMKFKSPIFVLQNIIDEAGYSDDEPLTDEPAPSRSDNEPSSPRPQSNHDNPFANIDLEELEIMLEEAINAEDYIKAARIRDEIARRK
jgi:bifunctional DNase/RNase